MELQNTVILYNETFRDKCTTDSQIYIIKKPIQSALKDKPLFRKKYFPDPYKTFFNFFLILNAISDKKCETRTSCTCLMFVTSLPVQSWFALPDVAFSRLRQY